MKGNKTMKHFLCVILALTLVIAVPMSASAASLDEEVSPMAVITVKSSITKATETKAKISATSQYDSTISLTATAQLQWKYAGVWRDYGTAVTNSTTGQSITASKRINLTQGYEYRVKGTHRIGVQTYYSYSETMFF